MKLKVFAVFDDKARAYLPPFFMPEVAMAVRVFGDCLADAEHQFGKHPEDYTLFLFGSFDCGTGAFEMLVNVSVLANGVQLKKDVQS